MYSRHLLFGTVAVLLCAAGGFTQGPDCGRPANIDVDKLKAAKKTPKDAVGGSKTTEGYVAGYGAFRLGREKREGNVIVRGSTPGTGSLRRFSLVYINEYKDPVTGVSGSLYYASLDKGTQRFYLFGNKDVACPAPVQQRAVFTFDGKGKFLQQTLASYAKAPKEDDDD